jgi:hypothetical protein
MHGVKLAAAAQLRRHVRVRISAPFPCSLGLLGLKKWLTVRWEGLGVVYDVSSRGARVMTEAAIQPGDYIAISLQFPDQASSMRVERAIVRWSKDQTYGVEFYRFGPTADMKLRKFLRQASHLVPPRPI